MLEHVLQEVYQRLISIRTHFSTDQILSNLCFIFLISFRFKAFSKLFFFTIQARRIMSIVCKNKLGLHLSVFARYLIEQTKRVDLYYCFFGIKTPILDSKMCR